jgi:hypothetical protein
VVSPMDGRPVPAGLVRLVASISMRSDPDRVAELLDGGGTPWADGRIAHPDGQDLRRFAVDLHLRVGAASNGLTTFGKAAFLDLGSPRRVSGGWEAAISWQASTATPLFPVFSGWLNISAGEMRIDGLYAPPGGVIGLIADRVLLHLAANATARWVLGEIDRAAVAVAA